MNGAVLVGCVGFALGFAYRAAHADKVVIAPPTVIEPENDLGARLIGQIKGIETSHLFAGDQTRVVSHGSCVFEGRKYLVDVKRASAQKVEG